MEQELPSEFEQLASLARGRARPSVDVEAMARTAEMYAEAGVKRGEGKVVFSGYALPRWVGYAGYIATAAVMCALGIKYVPAINLPESRSGQARTYTTIHGQRANVTLDDGSTVVLAPATTMRVKGRSVELAGEAMFTVKHNRGSVFTVRSGNSTTRVLGTTFGVRAYDSFNVRVVVQKGKVAVGTSGNREIVLTDGDVAVAGTSGITSVQHDQNIVLLTGWTSGKISFREARMSDVIPELERWFGIDITVKNEGINALPLTATFRSQSIAELSEILSVALGITIRQNGSEMILYGIKQ